MLRPEPHVPITETVIVHLRTHTKTDSSVSFEKARLNHSVQRMKCHVPTVQSVVAVCPLAQLALLHELTILH